jgi:hypothetical protein
MSLKLRCILLQKALNLEGKSETRLAQQMSLRRAGTEPKFPSTSFYMMLSEKNNYNQLKWSKY